MKRTTKPQLKVRSLETDALQKVHGGRGSYCGNIIHCDCGYAWTAGSGNTATCPSCGAATGIAASTGGGGGGGGGGCLTVKCCVK